MYQSRKYHHNHVACGGTFDLLHKGHKSILNRAFRIAKQVSIGVTTDLFCKELGKSPNESQQIRRKNLVAYLKSNSLEKRAKIVWLNDIYGITVKDKTLEAIVVSKETTQGARIINERRSKLKLGKLQLVICPQLLAKDGKKISTGRIKDGEISKEGINYTNLLLKIAGKRFNERIRAKLKKPFGKIVRVRKNTRLSRPLIAVGDVSVQTLLKNRSVPDISVIDFLVNRRPIFADVAQLGFTQPNPDYILPNAPGQISKKLIETIKKAINTHTSSQIILIDGEEDLAFIPALLQSKIPATIVYGQPNIGLVKVDVTCQAKDKLCSLLHL